ncbi:hypothetical protein HispidOSU_016127, partial [Sigmodon hispidus]
VNVSSRDRTADICNWKHGCKSLGSLCNHLVQVRGQGCVQWCRDVQALVTIAALVVHAPSIKCNDNICNK